MALLQRSQQKLNTLAPSFNISGSVAYGAEGAAIPAVINPSSTYTGSFVGGMAVKIVAGGVNDGMIIIDVISSATDVIAGYLSYSFAGMIVAGSTVSYILPTTPFFSPAGSAITSGSLLYWDFTTQTVVPTASGSTTTKAIGTALTATTVGVGTNIKVQPFNSNQ